MAKKNKKRTDKQREHQPCGGCDCVETADGCECRIVSCGQCCYRDNLYNMNHDEFHTEYWFNGMDFNTKMCEIICNRCVDETNDY